MPLTVKSFLTELLENTPLCNSHCSNLESCKQYSQLQAAVLVAFGGLLLNAWGASAGTEMRIDAAAFLRVKALGSPVTVLLLVIQVSPTKIQADFQLGIRRRALSLQTGRSLIQASWSNYVQRLPFVCASQVWLSSHLHLFWLQGIFRGLGDTKTPFIATATANGLNILLDPIFIFVLGWGAPGAGAATVLSQVGTTLGKGAQKAQRILRQIFRLHTRNDMVNVS